MIARLRPLYNIFVAPLGRASAALGITADAWTLFSLFASILGSIALYLGKFWWGFALVIVMFAADVMDGATARAGGTPGPFGTILDHVVDRYAEFFVIGGLAVGGWISPLVAFVAISGMIMASYVRAKAESTGQVKDCTVGVAGRAEKLILTYAAIVALALGSSWWASLMLVIAGLLSHFTALQRLLYSKMMIRQSA